MFVKGEPLTLDLLADGKVTADGDNSKATQDIRDATIADRVSKHRSKTAVSCMTDRCTFGLLELPLQYFQGYRLA